MATRKASQPASLFGIRLTARQRRWIKKQAESKSVTESDVVRTLIDEAMQSVTTRRSWIDDMEALAMEVPEDVWRDVPADFMEQLDHYIYGTPKK